MQNEHIVLKDLYYILKNQTETEGNLTSDTNHDLSIKVTLNTVDNSILSILGA